MKSIDYVGKTVGIWKVLKKTDKRDKIGRVIYEIQNTKTLEKAFKTSNFLAQVLKYHCKSDKVGRPRKYLTIRIPVAPESNL